LTARHSLVLDIVSRPTTITLLLLQPSYKCARFLPDVDAEQITYLLSVFNAVSRDVVELLLKMQASANIPDLRGCFPLHLAAWRGNADICRILLCQGPSLAKVNAQVSKSLYCMQLIVCYCLVVIIYDHPHHISCRFRHIV